MDQSVPPATDRLYETDAYATETTAQVLDVTSQGVVLDRTLFYAESGGQPGDHGMIEAANGAQIPVSDTQYLPGRIRIAHTLAAGGPLQPGDSVRLAVDWDRRYRHMRMHTCLHVLCGLIDAPVTGCSIHVDRGRIDFDLPESLFTAEELEAWLQEEIRRDRPVRHYWRTGAEVAEALETVRTVKAPPATGERLRVVEIEDLDFQPCGGTHVRGTGELEGLHVTRMQKKSRHNRRVLIGDDSR